MVQFVLSPADHERVAEAVAAAERGTDGEIVTIVATNSDRYQDVPLHYAVLAMLLAAALATIDLDWLNWGGSAWEVADTGRILLGLVIAQAVLFLAVRYAVAWTPLKLALTPRATKRRRVRRRAVQYFKVGAERRTQARVGILLYLSTDEHMAELIADEAIVRAVSPERWGDAMAALVSAVRDGRSGDGMVAAVAAIGVILSGSFPKTSEDVNELPDRLIEL